MYTLSAGFGEDTSQGNLTDLPSTASTGTSGTVTVTKYQNMNNRQA